MAHHKVADIHGVKKMVVVQLLPTNNNALLKQKDISMVNFSLLHTEIPSRSFCLGVQTNADIAVSDVIPAIHLGIKSHQQRNSISFSALFSPSPFSSTSTYQRHHPGRCRRVVLEAALDLLRNGAVVHVSLALVHV